MEFASPLPAKQTGGCPSDGVVQLSGSGCSAYVAKPAWHKDPNCPGHTVADVSADSDPHTGPAVNDANDGDGWAVVGGTSAVEGSEGAQAALGVPNPIGPSYPLLRMTALLRHTLRSTAWGPLLAAVVTGLTIVAVPALAGAQLDASHRTTLLRMTAICAALGSSFVLDDPAARTIATTPMPRLLRQAVRIAVALPLPAVGGWWRST